MVSHTLSLKLVILKGYLGLGMVQGQVGGVGGGWRVSGFGWPALAPSLNLNNPSND